MEHYFTHTAQTDIDVRRVLDANGFDERLARSVHPLALAFERSEDLDSTFRHLMAELLRQFLSTHKSIRLLMRSWKEEPAGMADAMSLAREQVEKVYAVSLFLENPERWTGRYFRESWRNDYERHLVEAYERYALRRYDEYLNLQSDGLHRERLDLGITDEEEDFVEWRFHSPPGSPKAELPDSLKEPETLKRARGIADQFPTPAAVLREVSEPDLKRALTRLYREYGYLCGYTHSGFRKLLAGYGEVRSHLTPEQKQKLVDTEYALSIVLSYLSAAFACTEAATRRLPRGEDGTAGDRAVAGGELLAELATLWDELRETSLIGRALYEWRVARVLPPAVGTS